VGATPSSTPSLSSTPSPFFETLYEVRLTVELPTLQDDGAVATLLGAFAAAVEDRVRELLDDADAARAVVAAAPKGVARAQLASGAYSYVFGVKLPPSALGAAAARRAQPAGVRGLQATAPLDSLSTLLTDGTLVARMKEAGVGNAQDLIDSGAMGVAVAAVAPSGTGTTSGTPSPSGTSSRTGTPRLAPSVTPSNTMVGVSASLQLRGLPASAFDGGKLKPAAVGTIAAALKRGVEGACAACTVAVTRVVDSAGAVVYPAGRRLQAGASAYTVSYLIGGPAAAAAAAAASVNTGAVAAQLSGASGFSTPVTADVPSATAATSDSGGGGGSFSSGAIAGIAGAGAVVVVLVLCYFFSPRVRATMAALRGPPTPKATLGLRLHTVNASDVELSPERCVAALSTALPSPPILPPTPLPHPPGRASASS
jgi:hypothetical protein